MASPANQRSISRLLSVQALYQMDIGGAGLKDTLSSYDSLQGEYDKSDEDWFCKIVKGVHKNQKSLDPALHIVLRDDWPLKSLDATLRALLRAATYELQHCPEIDSNVIINEYMEVAKAFFTGDEPSMTNGVLDQLSKQLRAKPTEKPADE